MSLIDNHLDNIDDLINDEDHANLIEDDTPLNDAMDEYVGRSTNFDEWVDLMTENKELTLSPAFDDPQPDMTSFETIVRSLFYNILESSYRARKMDPRE